jgi:hypothetical protein
MHFEVQLILQQLLFEFKVYISFSRGYPLTHDLFPAILILCNLIFRYREHRDIESSLLRPPILHL